MINIQRIAVIIFLAVFILIGNAFLFGYPLPLKELPPQLTLESFNLPNNRVSTKTIDTNDPVYQKLKELLDKNRFGWKINISDFPTGMYTFRSTSELQPDFAIRCYKDGIILNVTVWGQYMEFINDIPNTLQDLGLPNLWPKKYHWLADE